MTITSVGVNAPASKITINGTLGNFAQGWDGSGVTGYLFDKNTKVLFDPGPVAVQDPPVNGQRTFSMVYNNVPNGTYHVLFKGHILGAKQSDAGCL